MASVVFCHAAQDAEVAREIGAYLEVNLPVEPSYEEGLIRTGDDLLKGVGRGLSADMAIVLLSPDSVPSKWDRDLWEPALIHQPRELRARLYFLLVRECRFPELLRRQAFAVDARGLKRLIFKPVHRRALPGIDPEVVGHSVDAEALVDRPGLAVDIPAAHALRFAHEHVDDFEGAFWIECAHRTEAGVLGEIAAALQVSATGSVEQNRIALAEFARTHRCLVILDHLAPQYRELATLGGRFSTVITGESPLPPPRPVNLLLSLAELKRASRFAEANEILEILIAASRAENDSDALHRYTWEQGWIFGHWGEPYSAAIQPVQAGTANTQLGFDF